MGHGFSKYHTLIERAVFVAVLLCIVRAVDARFVRLPGRHPLPGGVWLFARRQQNPNTDDADFFPSALLHFWHVPCLASTMAAYVFYSFHSHRSAMMIPS